MAIFCLTFVLGMQEFQALHPPQARETILRCLVFGVQQRRQWAEDGKMQHPLPSQVFPQQFGPNDQKETALKKKHPQDQREGEEKTKRHEQQKKFVQKKRG
jgi:transcriptional regulator with AAA-type ATPase domain